MSKILNLTRKSDFSKRALVFAFAVLFVSVFLFNLSPMRVSGGERPNPPNASPTSMCVGCPQPPEEKPGSITICKIILDPEGNVVTDASDYSPANFHIHITGESGIPNQKNFQAQNFSPNTVIGSGSLDAECVTYDDLKLGDYYYEEEKITPKEKEEKWEEPLYNDQYNVQVNNISDFFSYNGDLTDESRNMNSDGHVVLSEQRKERTIVVLNQYKEAPSFTADIYAYKVNCESEEFLPDWAKSSSNPEKITTDVIKQYIDDINTEYERDVCWFESGWSFQWGYNGASGTQKAVKKPGDFYGPASSSEGWFTFGPTGSGDNPAHAHIEDLKGNSVLWAREVLQEGYIPFTDSANSQGDYSAEMLCHTDAYKYDNYDQVDIGVVDDVASPNEYYCVAFNAPEEIPTYSISGRKWNDINGNREGDEDWTYGLPGWEITLSKGSEFITSTTTQETSTTTQEKGKYEFRNLEPGTYEVCEIEQEGWERTYPQGEVPCHEITIEDQNASDVSFGNKRIDSPISIYGSKVVCEEESDLPNWGTDSNNPSQITESTARDYVADSNGACHLEKWDFQWGLEGAIEQVRDFIGPAPVSDGWNKFSSYNEELMSIAEISGETSVIWVREALKSEFIPFSMDNNHTEIGDYSAEMLCHTDAYKYDNYDRVDNPEAGNDYYCAAFNAPTCTASSSDWNTVDMVNLGDIESEDDHEAEDWWGDPGVGNYGDRDGGDDIAIVRDGGAEGECSQETGEATFVLDAGAGASSLVLRHLDGLSNLDSFDVYVNGEKIGRYLDSQDSAEKWITTHFSLPEGTSGQLEVKIVNIDDSWSDCETYGQLAFNWAKVGYCGEPPQPECAISGIKFNDLNKDRDMNEGESGLEDWTIQLKKPIACESGEEWADSVVEYNEGTESDGSEIDSSRTDPNNALNEAQYDDTLNFVSLGFGGSLILEFDNIILNEDGNDIEVVETSYGNQTCETYPEKVTVHASQDGNNWEELGTGCLDSEFDLGSLAWAKYVKLVDATNPEDDAFSGIVDGYDVDGVKAIHCASDWNIVAETSTDSEGHYCFAPSDLEGLEPGEYWLGEELKPGWINITPLDYLVTIPANTTIEKVFGNYHDCTDADGDDYFAEEGCGTPVDCDDDDPSINPGADEICHDGIDNDCDGNVDYDDDECQEPTCKLKINFVGTEEYPQGYQNWGKGDLDEKIFVGLDDIPYNLNQWISLEEEPDSGLNEDVEGLAVKREKIEGEKRVKIFLFGGWTPGVDEDEDGYKDDREAVHGLATIEGGEFTKIENAPSDPYEKWDKDGYEFGNPGNDEAYLNSSTESEFISTVDVASDAYYIYYTCGDSGEEEICDGIDNDLDGEIDEGCDDDGDDYCDSSMEYDGEFLEVCPNGPGDCDDEDADVNPGATEICDGIDNNCDGEIDEGCDDDEDGYCDMSMGYAEGSEVCPNGPGDCDDEDADINPGEDEICDNGVDDNCNGNIDCEEESCYDHAACVEDEEENGGGSSGGGGGVGPTWLDIYNEGNEGVEERSAIVTWQTNLKSTSRVIYDTVSHSELGDPPNYGYAFSTPLDPAKVTYHTVAINGLEPGTTYYWRPVSAASPEKVGEETEIVFTVEDEEPEGPGEEEEPEEEPEEPGEPGGETEEPSEPVEPSEPGEPGGGTGTDEEPEGEEEEPEELVENGEGQSRAEEEGEEEVATSSLLAAIGEFFKVENPCLIAAILLSILAALYVFSRMRGEKKGGKDKYKDIIAGMIILAILAAIFECILLLIPIIILLIPFLKEKFSKKEGQPQM